MVWLVDGNVIVVESVPARVSVLLAVNVLPLAIVSVAEVAGAVMVTLLRLPLIRAEPVISSFAVGEVLPIPTFPDELTVITSVPFVLIVTFAARVAWVFP